MPEQIDNVTTQRIPMDYKIKCMQNYLKKVDINKYLQYSCCVCDSQFYQTEIDSYELTTLLNYTQILNKNNLSYSKELPNEDLKFKPPFNSLNALVISKNGFNYHNGTVNICRKCKKNLDNQQTPKFAMVNDLYYSELPELGNTLTIVEITLLSVVRLKCCIFKIQKYGNFGKIKGNIITYMQEPFHILESFPSLEAYETIQVVFANNIDTEIDLNIMKIFTVRRAVVLKFAQWFYKYNRLYKERIKKINMNVILQLTENGIPIELKNEITRLNHESNYDDNINNSTTSLNDQYSEDQCEPNQNFENENINSEVAFEKSGIINELSNNKKLTYITKLLDAKYVLEKERQNNNNIFILNHDKQPVQEYQNPEHLLGAFPTLFWYGWGGIEDPNRKIKISYRDHVKYLLGLTGKHFATNESFIFVVWNIIQRSSNRLQIHLMLKQLEHSSFITALSNVTIVELQKAQLAALHHNPIEPVIRKLIQMSRSSSSKVQGTAYYHKHNRNEIRGLMLKNQQPSIFLTINPVDLHDRLMFVLTENQIPDNELFKEKNYFKRLSILTKNPVAHSKYYDIIMQAFFDYLLGYDNKNNTSNISSLNTDNLLPFTNEVTKKKGIFVTIIV
jgi:hypothetical protein